MLWRRGFLVVCQNRDIRNTSDITPILGVYPNLFGNTQDERSSASPLTAHRGGGWRKSEADAAHQAANGFARNALRALPPAATPIGRHAASRHRRGGLTGRPYSRGHGADRSAAQRLSAGFPADAQMSLRDTSGTRAPR